MSRQSRPVWALLLFLCFVCVLFPSVASAQCFLSSRSAFNIDLNWDQPTHPAGISPVYTVDGSNCNVTITGDQPWLQFSVQSLPAPGRSTYNITLNLGINENTTGVDLQIPGFPGYFGRLGHLTVNINGIATVATTIGQFAKPACTFIVSPSVLSMGANGGPSSISVQAIPNSPSVPLSTCTWDTVSAVSWITGITPKSSFGGGSVGFSVSALPPATPPRSGHLTVAGQDVIVNEGTSISITSPADNATPHSRFVALTGTAPPGDTVTILVDGAAANTTSVDSSGYWEQVAYAGLGLHTMQARDGSTTSNLIRVLAGPTLGTSPILPNTPYTMLRTADIMLTHGTNSVQVQLYGPTYTHAALFIGGDAEGTPLIAEAVPAAEAGADSSGPLGEVRSVPIELSTVYTDGQTISFFRPIASLSTPTRNAVAAAAAHYTSQNLAYWNPALDLAGPFLRAWLFWNSIPTSTVRFNQAKALMLGEKNRTDSFICSTLVWRSYLDGTGGMVDLSLPNNVNVTTGYLAEFADPTFLQAVSADFVFPDTIGLNNRVVFRVF